MAKGIILAAGRGKRMDHETDDKPKCLTKLLGKPLIDWQIRSLHEAGIYDIAVVTGYKGDCLDSFGLHRFVNENWARTQIFESLNCAHSWLESFECIVSYSDIVYEKTAIMGLLDAMDNVAVSYDTRWLDRWSRRFTDPLVDAETFKIDKSGSILEIGLKTRSLTNIQGQYMGLLKTRPDGWAILRRAFQSLNRSRRSSCQITGLLNFVIENELARIRGVPFEGFWGEVDSISDLKVVENELLTSSEIDLFFHD